MVTWRGCGRAADGGGVHYQLSRERITMPQEQENLILSVILAELEADLVAVLGLSPPCKKETVLLRVRLCIDTGSLSVGPHT